MIWTIFYIVTSIGILYLLYLFIRNVISSTSSDFSTPIDTKPNRTRRKGKKPENPVNTSSSGSSSSAIETGKKRRRNYLKKQETTYKPVQPKCDFQQREFLPVPNAQRGLGLTFTIMTYNVLAQALVKRLLYPFSGDILKWKRRYDVIKQEIKYYDPTVLCMQEVDVEHLPSWTEFLSENGYYTSTYEQAAKKHCLLIAYKHDQLVCRDNHKEEYEDENIEHIPQGEKKNGALVSVFEFSKELCEKYPYLSSKGLLVGTTHLYWLPLGCFDRTSQCYRLLEMMKNVQSRYPNRFVSIVAGDFNTEPHDPPYLLMTTKAESTRSEVIKKLATSLLWSSQLPTEVKEFPDDHTKSVCETSATELTERYHSLENRAVSLYSIAHGTDDTVNEPEFTNWTPNFKGTLDYIFALIPYQRGRSNSLKDCAKDLEDVATIRPLRYLALPTSTEMNKKNVLGLPKLNYSPSDHYSVMVELELLS